MTDAFQREQSRVWHRSGPLACTLYRQRVKLTLDDKRWYTEPVQRCGPIPVTEAGAWANVADAERLPMRINTKDDNTRNALTMVFAPVEWSSID